MQPCKHSDHYNNQNFSNQPSFDSHQLLVRGCNCQNNQSYIRDVRNRPGVRLVWCRTLNHIYWYKHPNRYHQPAYLLVQSIDIREQMIHNIRLVDYKRQSDTLDRRLHIHNEFRLPLDSACHFHRKYDMKTYIRLHSRFQYLRKWHCIFDYTLQCMVDTQIVWLGRQHWWKSNCSFHNLEHVCRRIAQYSCEVNMNPRTTDPIPDLTNWLNQDMHYLDNQP